MASKKEVKETWNLQRPIRVSDQTKQALKIYCAKNNLTECDVANRVVREFLISEGAWNPS